MDLESCIRELCAKAVAAEGQELDNILLNLMPAIRAHMRQVRATADAAFAQDLLRLDKQSVEDETLSR